MSEVVIFYRDDVDWRAEEGIARKYFKCTKSRIEIKPNQLVIPRFSALPFYREQEYDITLAGAKLINSYAQHRYCADLKNYYLDLQGITPYLYYSLQDLPENGPFILKGETNGRKFLWSTHMYAETKQDAIRVHSRLQEDSMLQYQDILIRQYIPLQTFFIAPRGLPITREYRFFFYKSKVLAGGYYWSNYYDDIIETGEVLDPKEVPDSFLQDVANRIQSSTTGTPPNFYVVDVAKTTDDKWIVIELNDGSMSGLSMVNPEELYSKLKQELDV
jgi:hypothetical protein